ncbi:MAG: DUF932 domain-containing protein [Desulfobacteraceae bacterium]|nr:MAG: DUF932 domain-containing protein [Desulfobacteraceae bacterium]
MEGLSVNRGTSIIGLDELKAFPVPLATATYTPVPHYDLSRSIRTIGQDMLTGFNLINEQYAVARNGNQLFALITMRADNSEMGLSIGFRNSYDKSMSIGIAIGSQVFVCENLMMTGDITVMKKHTPNVLATLEEATISTLYRAQYTFSKLVKDSQLLKAKGISDQQAFQMLGILFGHGILSSRQLPVALEEWQKPRHPDFQPRNAFSLYQACTESLKSSPPINVMERHINLHRTIINGQEVWGNDEPEDPGNSSQVMGKART